MFRTVRITLSLVALAVLPLACGSDDEGRLFTADELGSALLSVDDVGSAWSERSREVFTTRGDQEIPTLDPGMWCPDAAEAAESLQDLAGEAGALVFLDAPRAERRTFHGLSEQIISHERTDEFFRATSSAIDTCTGEEWTVEPDGERASIAELEGPEVGDESIRALVTYVTESPEGEHAWRSRLMVFRVGTIVVVLNELDVQPVGSEPFWSDTEWAEVVEGTSHHVLELAGE